MAIKVNQNDITTVYCPAVNGVRSEAQAVRIYNGSAWVDVWTNIKIMTLLSNSITKGISTLSTDKRTLGLYKIMDGTTGTQSGGGTIVVYLEGLWTNPALTFDWQGGFTYQSSTGTWNSVPAGSISLYHRASGSTSTGTTVAVSNVGKIVSGGAETSNGSYSGALSGTYDRIGLSISIGSFSGIYYSSFMEVTVKNFNIGIQKVGFPDTLLFDYQDY